MGHALEIVNGNASYVGVRELPWHRLGTTLADQDGMDIDQMLTLANLDFTPTLQPVFATFNGQQLEIQGKQAVVADRPWGAEVLGVVGRRWSPVAPRVGAEFAEGLIHASEGYAGWQSAGMLRPENKFNDTIGSQCFYTLKLDGTVLIGGQDPLENYLLVTHGFDGSLAFTLAVTPIRVVCRNTQQAALGSAKQTWKMHHGKRIEGRMQEAREAITLSMAYCAEFQAEADKLIDQNYTDAAFAALIGQVFPGPDADASDTVKANYVDLTDKVMGYFVDGEANANIRGTKWAAYNAVTEYLDWGQTIKGGRDDVKRATRTMTGEYADKKLKAWALLTA